MRWQLLSDQNVSPLYVSKCIFNFDGSNLKVSLRNWIMPTWVGERQTEIGNPNFSFFQLQSQRRETFGREEHTIDISHTLR